MRSAAGWSAELLVWALVSFGLWWLTLSGLTGADAAAAGGSALVAGVAAVTGRRVARAGWSVRPAWARWLLPMPVAIAGDAFRVLRLAVRARRDPGRFVELRPGRRQRARLSAGRRAVATTVLSATPGSIVIDEDRPRDRLVVHELAAASARPAAAVERTR